MHPFIIILKPTAVIGGSKGMVHLHWLAKAPVVWFLPFVIWNYLSRVENLYLVWKKIQMSFHFFIQQCTLISIYDTCFLETNREMLSQIFFHFHSVDFEIAAMVGRRSSTGNKKSPTAAEPALARRPKRNISPKSYVSILTFQLISQLVSFVKFQFAKKNLPLWYIRNFY